MRYFPPGTNVEFHTNSGVYYGTVLFVYPSRLLMEVVTDNGVEIWPTQDSHVIPEGILSEDMWSETC